MRLSGSADDARFWDRTARKYATHAISDMAGYERTLARTTELIGEGGNIVELGCGTGTTALRLAPRIAGLVATDVSTEMIAIAREKASAAGTANARFVVAPADGTPVDDASADAVLAFNLLHLVTDRAGVLADIHRLLKPGGLFISKTPCLSEMNPFIRLAVPVARLFGKAPRVAFFDAAALEAEIAAAGFVIAERARHGSTRKDPRIFLVARKQAGR